ncbi:MAG TPA: YHS domain-containing protein [Blastocatellia bacterium]|nr:YHS domain-containing protein [Blastocatellia bacterium]
MANHTDPVCGMPVDEQYAAGKSGYKSKMYYFCSQDCKTKFDRSPEQFAEAERGAQSAGKERYT